MKTPAPAVCRAFQGLQFLQAARTVSRPTRLQWAYRCPKMPRRERPRDRCRVRRRLRADPVSRLPAATAAIDGFFSGFDLPHGKKLRTKSA
jgi:hypothetical protein